MNEKIILDITFVNKNNIAVLRLILQFPSINDIQLNVVYT